MSKMSRFEQRLRARRQNTEFDAGYREMAAELDLIQAIDAVRDQLHVSKDELALRMGKKREAVSRILNTDDANPTLETITGMLDALGVTAEVTLRQADRDEAPIRVHTAL